MKTSLYLLKLVMSFTTAVPEDELECMSRTVYHEARGESVLGQYMVAKVIHNRMNSEEFPDTACEVVSQTSNGVQFSGNLPFPKNPEVESVNIAKIVSRLAHSDLVLVENFEKVYWFTQTGEYSKFHKQLVPAKTEQSHTFFHG